MLNGCRVDVRHSEPPAPNAFNVEASKKSVYIVYYENHNYVNREWVQIREVVFEDIEFIPTVYDDSVKK